MPQGTVKFFRTDKGYGFIELDGGGGGFFVRTVHTSASMAMRIPCCRCGA
jgi:cold shock CspA family protein